MDNDEPNLKLLWDTFTGYQRTAALKAAIELDVFTADRRRRRDRRRARGRAATRRRAACARCCNHLVIDGFLTRDGERYGLSATAAAFLDRTSPSYLGSAVSFIASPMIVDGFTRLTDAVRRGGTAVADDGTLAPEHPVWVEFARAMAPLAGMTAVLLANLLDVEHAPGVEGARHRRRPRHVRHHARAAQPRRGGDGARLEERPRGRRGERARRRRADALPHAAGQRLRGAVRRRLRLSCC